MKEWLTLIIVLLIIIILLDGWRRMRNARYGNIRMSPAIKKRLKENKPEEYSKAPSETPSYTSELPNGGARVIGHRDPGQAQTAQDKKSPSKSSTQGRQPSSDSSRRRSPEQARLNLGESVPMLMEEIQEPVLSRQDSSVRAAPGHGASINDGRDGDRIEPTISGGNSGNSAQHSGNAEYQDDLDDAYEGEDYEEDDHPYDEELENDRDYGRDVEDHSRDEGEDDYTEDYDDDEDDDYEDSDAESDQDYVAASQSPTSAQLQSDPEEVLIINVMAHKGSMFNGSQLLDTLLQCGMRYGDMDIFHRYTDVKGEGALLFSMANMVKPGTFDLDAMDEFATPGVSLFMTLPLKADSMQSFELMLETAKSLAEALNGELKDEQRSVMTRQTIEHCRQRILDFERRRLFQRPR